VPIARGLSRLAGAVVIRTLVERSKEPGAGFSGENRSVFEWSLAVERAACYDLDATESSVLKLSRDRRWEQFVGRRYSMIEG